MVEDLLPDHGYCQREMDLMELGWTKTVHSRGFVRNLEGHHRAFGPRGIQS